MRRLPLLPLFPLLLLPTSPAHSQPRSPILFLAQTQLTPQQEQQLAELYKQFSEKYQQGKYDEALSLAQKLVPFIRGKLGSNSSEFANFLTVLGIISVGRNSPAEAESFFKEALVINASVFRDKNPNTAMVLEHLSRLYLSQGNYAAAEPLLKQSLAIRKNTLGEKDSETAQSFASLGVFYLKTRNYAEAEPLLKQSLAICKEVLGEKHPDTATSLYNLAELYRAQENYSAAEPLYLQALAIRKEALGEKHPDTALSLNGLALLYGAQEKYNTAKRLLEQALTILKEDVGEKHPAIAVLLQNLMALHWETNDISQTIVLLRQGADIEETNLDIFLNQIGDESRKQIYISGIKYTIDITISLHLNSAADNPQAADLALTTILRRKGRVLDALSNTVALLRQRLNPSIQDTFDDLGAKRSRLASLSFQGPGKLPPEVFKQELATLNQQIQTLESQLSSRSAEFRAENQPITVGAVQNLLPKEGALVEYIVYSPYDPKTNKYGKPRYAAYVLLPNGNIKGVDLGDGAEIDKLIAAWLQTLNTPPGKGLPFQKRAEREQKAAGAELTAKIFTPLRPYLKNAQHLLIAPDSQLNLIPFAALPDGAGGKYLIQDYQLTFLTSGRDLLKLQNPAPSRSPSLVMGNPDYGASVLTKPGDAPRSADIGKLDAWCCSPLPGAQAEVEALRPLLPGANIYTGAEAGVDKLEPLQAPPILHLAAHGFFLPDNPPPADPKPGLTGNLQETLKPDLRDNPLLRSGLALTGFNPRENKYGGALTALEATTLDLWGTKLVVLSACQTGVGDVRTGEGVYGLRRAFVLAGAESQVMSLWNVSDLSTQSLMVKYYQKLQQGVGRSEALRQVQLEMLQGEEYPNPYYWAAFTPSGDWRPFQFN